MEGALPSRAVHSPREQQQSATSSLSSRDDVDRQAHGQHLRLGRLAAAAARLVKAAAPPEHGGLADLHDMRDMSSAVSDLALAAAEERRRGWRRSKTHIFVDPEEMKRLVRENLTKPTYDVSVYYHPGGLWRDIATSLAFGRVTLAVIAANALWIGIDTQYNSADTLVHASALFQVVEYCFCTFFAFEWLSRFMAFKRKRDTLRDAWFLFDTFLACTMVFETWVLTALLVWSGQGGGTAVRNASILRIGRLARLSRMARIARLLRSMPELMILIKGMAAATRSVFFTLMLLCLVIYIFAIAFTQLAATEGYIADMYFKTVPDSMYSLLVYGVLLDGTGDTASDLAADSDILLVLFLFFVLLGAMTIMNMLIGVLTAVVSATAATEREALMVTFVKNKMQSVVQGIDRNADGLISKQEFCEIIGNKQATQALTEVGVDVVGLVDFADFIYAEEQTVANDARMDFSRFMEVVLQFRGSNKATVKDIVNLRKFVGTSLNERLQDVLELKEIVLSRTAALGTISPKAAGCPAPADGLEGEASAKGGELPAKPSKRRRREEERLPPRPKGGKALEPAASRPPKSPALESGDLPQPSPALARPPSAAGGRPALAAPEAPAPAAAPLPWGGSPLASPRLPPPAAAGLPAPRPATAASEQPGRPASPAEIPQPGDLEPTGVPLPAALLRPPRARPVVRFAEEQAWF